ncbi:hypothetical protein B0I35DRAFT_348096 [Stachybotrys elegans]|uniref:Uncharacterized protein n=1 Tax=Stachybotrys elegans TaxID=80388 RepID=A0A8K0STC6_9HYPO|nr:hypothetical protein B0I35DRAFT_348096 [Stachybotrys elegans]
MSLCKACEEPLVIRIDEDEAGDAAADTVPDDLELPCGCHFHWQCLLDESAAISISLKCPSCDKYLPTNEAGPSTSNQFLHASSGVAILAQYTNEGGFQKDLDILPSITEEAYLESHPEARPARAMHIMCSEGDVVGIVELLRDASDEVGDMASFVRYQDPLSEMKSGLHVAVEKGQEEAVWLLLWLCSTIPTAAFPGPARQAAEAMGVGRLGVAADGDIRALRDSQGRTAEDTARQSGAWTALLDAGVFTP